MREFEGFIFPNGRIVAIPEEEYMAAIEAGKEILVFCGGWAGGYARAFGADKEQDIYEPDKTCYMAYSYDVMDKTFTPEDMKRFAKVIVTDGIRVYMKTGESASDYYSGTFCDCGTKDRLEEHYPDTCSNDIEQYDFSDCQTVDFDMTVRMLGADDKDYEGMVKMLKEILR